MNDMLSAVICLSQTLTLCKSRTKHFVRNLRYSNSVVQRFNRNGICIKLRRLLCKIFVRTCSGKLFKYRMKNRLSDDICLSQTLSLRKKNILNIFQEFSRFKVVQFKILTEMESAFNYKDSDIKYVLVRAPESCLKLG